MNNIYTLCLTYGLQAAVAATRHQDAAHTQEAVRLERMPPLTDYGHTKAKSLTLCGPNSNPNSE